MLPAIMFVVAAAALVFIYLRRGEASSGTLVIGTAIFAFGAGAMFMMFTDRRGPR